MTVANIPHSAVIPIVEKPILHEEIILLNNCKISMLTSAIFFGSFVGTLMPAQSAESSEIWPILLRRDLARTGQVEWRLRNAAGQSCPQKATDIGIVFDDRRAYRKGDWPLLEASLKMRNYPVAASIAMDSPADRAGLEVGDEITAIGGITSDTIMSRAKTISLGPDALLDEIAKAMPNADLKLEIRRDGLPMQLIVRPVSHCSVRLVLFTNRQIEAHSDLQNVAISTGMLAFARTDDELALAAGHEIAHVINGDRRGAPIKVRRAMEDAADSLGLRMMECAGYRRNEGVTLFERLGSRDWLGFLRAPTHRSWKARVQSLRALPAKAICPVMSR